MKFLTLNTHSLMEENQETKLRQLAQFIHQQQVDLIALQEVNQSLLAPVVASPLHFINPGDEVIKEDNFALQLVQYLAQEWKESFQWTWTKNHLGFDRFDEGVAILTKLPIQTAFRYPLSQATDPNDFHTRIAVGVQLKNHWTALSLHASWWRSPQTKQLCFSYEAERLNQLKQHLTDPLFLLGDFNNPSHITQEGYQLMIENWFDTYLMAQYQRGQYTMEGEIAGWRGNNQGQRIDFIFSNQLLPISSAQIVFDGREQPVISDHYGYLIQF